MTRQIRGSRTPSPESEPPPPAGIVAMLRSALGAGAVSTDPGDLEDHSEDALGGGRGAAVPPVVVPLAVVRPATTEQVRDIVRIAHEHAIPLVAYGGGTGLMGGARSTRAGIVIDLCRVDAVREIDADAGWAWVEAGARLAAADAVLRERGVMLGHDPWTVAIATVGGALSTNGLGFLGGAYGSMGEQVLAVEAVVAPGEIMTTRPVQPRSTGIDLTRLFTGAEGAFGIVTAAALRVFPVPEAQMRAGFHFATFDRGFEAILEMRRERLAWAMLDYGERTPEAAARGWSAEPPTLYLGFEGARDETALRTDRASAVCARFGATAIGAEDVEEFWNGRHVIAENFAARRRASRGAGAGPPGNGVFDYIHVSLPASRVLEYRREAMAIAASEDVSVVETGLWVAPGLFSMVMVCSGTEAGERMSGAVDDCLRLAHAHGGSMEYCHGAGLRLAHLMREEHGAGLDVMRAIKRALDPKGIFNPIPGAGP